MFQKMIKNENMDFLFFFDKVTAVSVSISLILLMQDSQVKRNRSTLSSRSKSC